MGGNEFALDYFRRAAEVLGDGAAKTDYEERVRSLVVEPHPDDGPGAIILARRKAYRLARARSDRADRGYELAAVLLESDPELDFEEACGLLAASFAYYRAERSVSNYLQCLDPLIYLHGHHPWPASFDDVTRHGIQLADTSGVVGWRAIAHLGRAAWLTVVHDWTGAIDHALHASALAMKEVLASASSALRTMQNTTGDAARWIALRAAIAVGDVDLVLELVESARLQVLPDIDVGDLPGRERQDVVSWVLETAARRVGPLHPISVSGRSRTADYLRKHGVAVAEPIPVEVFVEAVGGPEAWWWGSWAYHDSYFWCVAGEGSRDVGEVDISGDIDAGRVVEVARFASLSNDESTDADIRSGPYCSDHPREEQMSAALGAVLVPAPLRRRLIRGRGRPLSLVVTGNLTALLPFPLLGIDVDPVNGQVTRLVETAVIRAAPPAVLINRVADHPCTWSTATRS